MFAEGLNDLIYQAYQARANVDDIVGTERIQGRILCSLQFYLTLMT